MRNYARDIGEVPVHEPRLSSDGSAITMEVCDVFKSVLDCETAAEYAMLMSTKHGLSKGMVIDSLIQLQGLFKTWDLETGGTSVISTKASKFLAELDQR